MLCVILPQPNYIKALTAKIQLGVLDYYPDEYMNTIPKEKMEWNKCQR